MTRAEIDRIVGTTLERIEQLKNIVQPEDTLLELKGPWSTDYNKAARQLAGRLNAAKGDYVLWLFGVDEKEGMVTLDNVDVTPWYQNIKKEFDGQAPNFRHYNIQCKAGLIVALLFVGGESLYQVKTAHFGKEKGERCQFEVPWHEAGTTRTATRNEILGMLLPKVKKPSLEIIHARLEYKPNKALACWGQFYVVPQNGDELFFPFHKVAAVVISGGSKSLVLHAGELISDGAAKHSDFPEHPLGVPFVDWLYAAKKLFPSRREYSYLPDLGRTGRASLTLHDSSTELVVKGAGMFHFFALGDHKQDVQLEEIVELSFKIPIGIDDFNLVSCELKRSREGLWELQ
jgi:hypothetical protein